MNPIGVPDDPVITALLTFWETARGQRPMPSKADVDPLRLGPKLLPHLLLVEPVDGERLRYRLCGTAITQAAGLDLTGLHIDQLNPNLDYVRYVDGLYRRAAEARRPVYSESRCLEHQSTSACGTRRLICPLSDDSQIVNRFIAAQSFQPSRAGQPPGAPSAAGFEPQRVLVL